MHIALVCSYIKLQLTKSYVMYLEETLQCVNIWQNSGAETDWLLQMSVWFLFCPLLLVNQPSTINQQDLLKPFTWCSGMVLPWFKGPVCSFLYHYLFVFLLWKFMLAFSVVVRFDCLSLKTHTHTNTRQNKYYRTLHVSECSVKITATTRRKPLLQAYLLGCCLPRHWRAHLCIYYIKKFPIQFEEIKKYQFLFPYCLFDSNNWL